MLLDRFNSLFEYSTDHMEHFDDRSAVCYAVRTFDDAASQPNGGSKNQEYRHRSVNFHFQD